MIPVPPVKVPPALLVPVKVTFETVTPAPASDCAMAAVAVAPCPRSETTRPAAWTTGAQMVPRTRATGTKTTNSLRRRRGRDAVNIGALLENQPSIESRSPRSGRVERGRGPLLRPRSDRSACGVRAGRCHRNTKRRIPRCGVGTPSWVSPPGSPPPPRAGIAATDQSGNGSLGTSSRAICGRYSARSVKSIAGRSGGGA